MRSKSSSRSGTSRLISLALLAFAPAASAQTEAPPAAAEVAPVNDIAGCIEAFDEAQRERSVGRLLSAQKLTLKCSQPTCGNTLMSECTQMYSDIERALPSVVLSAHDEALNIDLTTVEVTMNGEPLSSSLDGRPIPIDPGEYEFVFAAPGHSPVKRRAVIATGNKYRVINIVFPDPNPRKATPVASVSVSPTLSAAEPAKAAPVMPWVLGGVGVVGLGAGGVLRLIGNNDFNAMKEGCAARGCPDSDIESLESKYLLSNIALGVGAAATVGAVLWYVIDGPLASEQSTLAIVPAPDGRGAFATAQGHF